MHSDVENSEEKEPVEDSEGKRSRAFSWVYTRVYEDFWVSLWPFLIILSNCLDVLPFLLRPPHTSGSIHCDRFHAAGESAEGHIPQDSHDNSQHSQTTGTRILHGTKGKHDGRRKYGDLHQEKNTRVWKNTWIAAKDGHELYINTYYWFICWDSKLFMAICNSEIKSS